ncbi:MAG: cytochrome c oxidase subunit II [Deltaproteobacteria bacterium]|nr:cytochrome c oxidase subunit II [Deltaproteobacteria bacterium]
MLALFKLPQSSTMAPNIDNLFNFILWVSIVSFTIIVVGLIVFVLKYHRRRSDPEKTPYIEGHTPLELSICTVLFVLLMGIFAWGWIDYAKIITPAQNAVEINLIGRQWLWELEYSNGRKLTNELVIPKGKPVTLIMSSADVIHSFFVPAFRLKQDVVPGAYTQLNFTATEIGIFPAYCAEYCGTAHSGMIAKVRVVEPEAFEKWQQIWEIEQQLGEDSRGDRPVAPTATTEKPEARGQRIYAEKGCSACHTTTGQPLVGPSFKGLFGKQEELADGKKTTVDENYLRESIMDPQAKLVKGFQPVMPTYKGQLSDEEVNGIVAFIKSLKN